MSAATGPKMSGANKSPDRKSLDKTVAKVLEDKVLRISNEAANRFCYCNAPSSKNLIGKPNR